MDLTPQSFVDFDAVPRAPVDPDDPWNPLPSPSYRGPPAAPGKPVPSSGYGPMPKGLPRPSQAKPPPAAPMTVDGWQFANPMDSHGVSTKKPVEPDSTSPPKAKSRVTFVEPVPSSASSSSSIASAVPETSLAMQKGQVLMKIVENEKDATLQ